MWSFTSITGWPCIAHQSLTGSSNSCIQKATYDHVISIHLLEHAIKHKNMVFVTFYTFKSNFGFFRFNLPFFLVQFTPSIEDCSQFFIVSRERGSIFCSECSVQATWCLGHLCGTNQFQSHCTLWFNSLEWASTPCDWLCCFASTPIITTPRPAYKVMMSTRTTSTVLEFFRIWKYVMSTFS